MSVEKLENTDERKDFVDEGFIPFDIGEGLASSRRNFNQNAIHKSRIRRMEYFGYDNKPLTDGQKEA